MIINGIKAMISERENDINVIEGAMTEKENTAGRLAAEVNFLELSTSNKDTWYNSKLTENSKNYQEAHKIMKNIIKDTMQESIN